MICLELVKSNKQNNKKFENIFYFLYHHLMKKISLIAFLLFTFSFFFTPSVLAQNKTKTLVKLPVFMAGENQIVDKAVDGDLMIAGSQVKITSNINGDLYVAGGQVDISGVVSGNLIVAGGEITLSGKVLKNLITAGGQIKVDTTAEVNGYLLAGAGTIDLLGKSGPAKVGAGTLTLGEKAVINGNLEADVTKSNISSTSKILGEKKIQIHEVKEVDKKSTLAPKFAYFNSTKEVISFLSKVVLLFILVKLFGQKIIETSTKKSFWSNLGLGLTILIVTPFLSLMLLLTIIGIPLSGIIFSIYLIALSLTKVVTSIILGNYLFQKSYLKSKNQYLLSFLALLLLTLIGFIPFVGDLVKLFILLFGLGAITRSLQASFAKK